MSLEQDTRYMRRALILSGKARRISAPNPAVGAVIVKNDRIIGEGFTQQAGGPHAEIMAMRQAIAAGETLSGATAYVTLEPCAHYGRTPPCALALINAGIARVVAACRDPNPKVAGRGLMMLEEAGIETACGLLEQEAFNGNIGFMTRMTRGTSWVRLKTAITLDGRTALTNGCSKWITGDKARKDVQYWRGMAGAIVTGIGTVLADNPQMNVRLCDQVRQPLRIVVDRYLETPVNAAIVTSSGGRTVIVGAQDHVARRQALEKAGATVWLLPDNKIPQNVSLKNLLIKCAEMEVNEIHLEAGAGLNGAFLNEGLVDEMLIYIAPCLLGEGLPLARILPPASPGAANRWHTKDVCIVDNDVRMLLRRE